eukprot:280725-Chlamydomonas_euryale.AAC.1
MSAWMPAPPPESDPATTSTRGKRLAAAPRPMPAPRGLAPVAAVPSPGPTAAACAAPSARPNRKSDTSCHVSA